MVNSPYKRKRSRFIVFSLHFYKLVFYINQNKAFNP